LTLAFDAREVPDPAARSAHQSTLEVPQRRIGAGAAAERQGDLFGMLTSATGCMNLYAPATAGALFALP